MKPARIILFVVLCWGLYGSSLAQTEGVSINNTGADPDQSAILDIQSTTKGMLIPRMTSTQRQAINGGNPPQGLLVFDITTSSFWFYSGSAWQDLSVSNAGTPDQIADSDNNTKVQTEASANENVIRFDIDGQERANLDALGLNINTVNGIQFPAAFGPNTFFVGTPGNALSFGHAGVSEDFISYANNTFYFKDSPGGGDGADPNINTNGTIIAGSFVGDGANLTGISLPRLNDTDNDTRIELENIPDEDTIRFTVDGIAVAKLDNKTLYLGAPGESLFIGQNAGRVEDGASRGNTFVGHRSGEITSTGQYNAGFGALSLINNISGNQNTALGREAMVANASGDDNTAAGFVALRQNTNGNRNAAFGAKALVINSSGNENTAVGNDALFFNETGNHNSALGAFALNVNTVGSNNTAVGHNANTSANNLNNATAIGANALVSKDSSLVLGDAANVGIGTSSPDAKLHVVGQVQIVDGSQAAGRALVSDANGLATWQDVSLTAPDPNLPIPLRFQGDQIFVHPTENATDIDWTTAQTTCANLTAFGFSDWYLPSRLELDAMYKQSYLITGLSQNDMAKYWSNTELDTANAFTQRLDYGGPDPDEKTATTGHNCRCIRKNP